MNSLSQNLPLMYLNLEWYTKKSTNKDNNDKNISNDS